MGRTPSSVALKLGNIKAWDPMRSGKGLAHGSKLDAHVWEEYDAKGNELMEQAVSLLDARLGGTNAEGDEVGYLLVNVPEGHDRIVEATTRVNQSYFRNSLLEN